ncbi:glycosyltransferase family 4 protein [Algoriphagus pacificus]|uniref:Glycosyltransferase family 4 protein n=1 Tax=Algoriphagus pacificus TaxID=2811234 RepID=A0ABS3CKF6_9BACT|nr:glycosyltransferase family 4 protein [Algoriphagus pacificus]MBN7817572.1 glycosyltransferase family 4 protein [Algoriphagus pacificus]
MIPIQKKILLVGPLNEQGVGGRLEEMKVWARALDTHGAIVEVFSRFNSGHYFDHVKVWESAHIIFGKKIDRIPALKSLLIRVWASKFLKGRRELFFKSSSWNRFANGFDGIILFINDSSSEREIFESSLDLPIYIRFTGTLKNFDTLVKDGLNLNLTKRAYIFHDPNLLRDFIPTLPHYFIDQTAIQEEKLLKVPIDQKCQVFAMIGLFMEVKQVEEVIQTFANFPKLRLLLFGKGELESSYKKIIQRNSINNVEIRGFFPAQTMEMMFYEFDSLIINSSEETGPMTGVEAMAAGKIIISTRVGAMPGRLNNDFFIISPSNSLSDIIENLGTFKPQKIEREKMRLRNKYLENYSTNAISKQIADLILV